MPETQVQSLGQEDPPEKGMAAHSSILVWRISWTEKPGRLQPVGSQTVTTERLTHTHARERKRTGVMLAVLSPFLVVLGPQGPDGELFLGPLLPEEEAGLGNVTAGEPGPGQQGNVP